MTLVSTIWTRAPWIDSPPAQGLLLFVAPGLYMSSEIV
jgi:hypothetical protein